MVALGTQIAEKYPEATVDVEIPASATATSSPRLETAVRELLGNAVKHAGETPSITAAVTIDNDTASIQIQDDWPGIPAQDRAVLRTGEETPLVHGSGLGLLLAY